MIEYEQTDGCGSVRVKTTEGFAVLAFACSNPTQPLSLQCRVSAGSSSHLAGVIVENLVERYCPSVLVVEGDNTQLRYKPKIAQMFRCWTQDSQSVYAEAFSSRDLLIACAVCLLPCRSTTWCEFRTKTFNSLKAVMC